MKKPLAEIIIGKLGKKEGEIPMNDKMEEKEEGGEEYAIAQDVLDAIKNGDKVLLAESLEAIFNYFDSMPHKEGEHINEMED